MLTEAGVRGEGQGVKVPHVPDGTARGRGCGGEGPTPDGTARGSVPHHLFLWSWHTWHTYGRPGGEAMGC